MNYGEEVGLNKCALLFAYVIQCCKLQFCMAICFVFLMFMFYRVHISFVRPLYCLFAYSK